MSQDVSVSMKTIRIEKTVRNLKVAIFVALFLFLPFVGIILCVIGAFHDPSAFQELWPVFAIIILGCSWIFFIILSACCFSIRGKYIIEYDKDQLHVTTHSCLRTSSSVFLWSDILNVGYLASPRLISCGSLFVEMPRKMFRFGDELKYQEQIELAKQLYEAYKEINSQSRLGGDVCKRKAEESLIPEREPRVE